MSVPARVVFLMPRMLPYFIKVIYRLPLPDAIPTVVRSKDTKP